MAMNRILVTLLSLLTFMSMEASTILVEWSGSEGIGKTKNFTGNAGDILEFRCSGALPYRDDYVKIYLTVDGIRHEVVNYDYFSNLSTKSYKIIYFQLPESKDYSLSYDCNASNTYLERPPYKSGFNFCRG